MGSHTFPTNEVIKALDAVGLDARLDDQMGYMPLYLTLMYGETEVSFTGDVSRDEMNFDRIDVDFRATLDGDWGGNKTEFYFDVESPEDVARITKELL